MACSIPHGGNTTRMLANAQHDGHPAEHRWRPLHRAKFRQGATTPENVYIMH